MSAVALDAAEAQTAAAEARTEAATDRDDAAQDARHKLLSTSDATLCTLTAKPELAGHPYGSVVPYALDPSGRPFVLLARIAAHTANLRQDPRATVFVRDPEPKGDPQATWRVSVMGRMRPLATPGRAGKAQPGALVLDEAILADLDARYRARVPSAQAYHETHSFDYWLMTDVLKARYIAGFGRICWIDGHRLLRDPHGAGIGETAPSAIAHMNEDHRSTLIEMCAGLHGLHPTDAEMVTLDRAGFSVRTRGPDAHVFFEFGREIDARQLRPAVIEVLHRARAHAT